MKRKKQNRKLPEFSLRGILKIHQFYAIPGSICNLCQISGLKKVPAVCRQVEQGVDTNIELNTTADSIVAKETMPALFGPDSKPIESTLAPVTEARPASKPLRQERCLCKRHLEIVTLEAVQLHARTGRPEVVRYEKYDFDTVAERGY